MTEKLHEKYVPILHFAKGERFFPMAVDDFLGYCTLKAKGGTTPLVARRRVTQALLASNYQNRAKVYLQSVPGALGEQNVAARWGKDVLQILEAGSARASRWRQDLARVARLAKRLVWRFPIAQPQIVFALSTRTIRGK